MTLPVYLWPSAKEFVDRTSELAALEKWWKSSDRTPVSLYGRRRCGKSWLFRRFAHGKPAVVLVARQTAPGAQLDDFAERLEPLLGVRPILRDLADLFRVLYRAAGHQKLIVVIDEFPYLLPGTEAEVRRELSAIATVMEEERDDSLIKLLICGSLVSQMESLLAEGSPLHGRLLPLQLQPVAFAEARLFMPGHDAQRQFERFAIAGGMPRYLTALSGEDALADVICDRILDRNAGLWDEGRRVLEQELREPKVYFAVLQCLATGDKESGEIASALRSDAQRISKYLNVLTDMRLIERRQPIESVATGRSGHWHLRDAFTRFWFRFVFPFQDDLEAGLSSRDLYNAEVAPVLSDHIAPEFEEFCRRWTRANGAVARVGAWWGPSLNSLRRSGTRSSEEIDIVGVARGRVAVVGEARWRNTKMDVDYLADIEQFKLPALRQSGLAVAKSPSIMLFSKGGYTERLAATAAKRDDIVLVDVGRALLQS